MDEKHFVSILNFKGGLLPPTKKGRIMINHVNHLLLIGTLGEDLKKIETKTGSPMGVLKVCTSDRDKDRTVWNSVYLFDPLLTQCQNYKKGMTVSLTAEVSERIVSESETNKYKTSIVANSAWVVDLGKSNRPQPTLESEMEY